VTLFKVKSRTPPVPCQRRDTNAHQFVSQIAETAPYYNYERDMQHITHALTYAGCCSSFMRAARSSRSNLAS